MIGFTDSEKTALVIAHPGHELCVYGWLENARPTVFVLTDGSGRSGVSRLSSTNSILASGGAVPGSIYGRFTDQYLYAAILDGNFAVFEEIVEELAETLVKENISSVAGDANEGYNSIHDVCRIVINAAVELANQTSKRPIINRDFLLIDPHYKESDEVRQNAIWLSLDDDQLERKLSLARAYPELRGEVDARLDKKTLERMQAFPDMKARFANDLGETGSEAYRMECLRLVNSPRCDGITAAVPFYEQYGEALVADGTYKEAIRYRDHMVPLKNAIWRYVDSHQAKSGTALLNSNSATN